MRSASSLHARGLRGVHVVAAHELRDGRLAHVVVLHAAEQVVEHAVAQRRLGHGHLLDVELVEDRVHDREAAGQHRRARRLQAGDAVRVGAAGVEQQVPQLLEALARDAVRGELVLDAGCSRCVRAVPEEPTASCQPERR